MAVTSSLCTFLLQKGGVLKSIFSCYFGADMSEDESHHGGGAYSGEDPSAHSAGGVGPRSKSCSAANDCSDRTVVRTMGDTVSPLPMMLLAVLPSAHMSSSGLCSGCVTCCAPCSCMLRLSLRPGVVLCTQGIGFVIMP